MLGLVCLLTLTSENSLILETVMRLNKLSEILSGEKSSLLTEKELESAFKI